MEEKEEELVDGAPDVEPQKENVKEMFRSNCQRILFIFLSLSIRKKKKNKTHTL